MKTNDDLWDLVNDLDADIKALNSDIDKLTAENNKLKAQRDELVEVLKQANKTLVLHGHIDSKTDLHHSIVTAIFKATP